MSTALGTLFKEHSSKIRIVISFLQAAQRLNTDIFFQSKIVHKIVLRSRQEYTKNYKNDFENTGIFVISFFSGGK